MRRTRLNVVPPISKPHGKDNVHVNGHANGHSNGNVIEGGFNGEASGHTGGISNGALATIALDLPSATLSQSLPDLSVTATMAEQYLAKGESRNERVRKLQEEAKRLAREQVVEFEILLEATSKMALDIADGGDIYSVGARELCRRLADELPRTLQTLQAITKRN